jgi:hypothetical protein
MSDIMGGWVRVSRWTGRKWTNSNWNISNVLEFYISGFEIGWFNTRVMCSPSSYTNFHEICKAQWLLYVPTVLTSTNSTFCPHSVFMCLYLRKNSDYFPIQHEVTGFCKREGESLLRGKSWIYIYIYIYIYNSGCVSLMISITMSKNVAWILWQFL